jgi:hypothetical protein
MSENYGEIRSVDAEVVRRPDSFDTGHSSVESIQQNDRSATRPNGIASILSNPAAIGSLGLTTKQAKNVRSLVTGAGAGLAHKYLSEAIGDELSGAVGAFLGAYLSKKVLGK